MSLKRCVCHRHARSVTCGELVVPTANMNDSTDSALYLELAAGNDPFDKCFFSPWQHRYDVQAIRSHQRFGFMISYGNHHFDIWTFTLSIDFA